MLIYCYQRILYHRMPYRIWDITSIRALISLQSQNMCSNTMLGDPRSHWQRTCSLRSVEWSSEATAYVACTQSCHVVGFSLYLGQYCASSGLCTWSIRSGMCSLQLKIDMTCWSDRDHHGCTTVSVQAYGCTRLWTILMENKLGGLVALVLWANYLSKDHEKNWGTKN